MENKIKLMVLDDEEGIVHYITSYFRLKGLQTYGAGYSAVALEIVKEHHPEICIVDIFLENSPINGIEVVRRIKQINKGTIFIMFSRIMDDDKVPEAKKEGAFKVLFKPCGPEELKKSVDSAVQIIRG